MADHSIDHHVIFGDSSTTPRAQSIRNLSAVWKGGHMHMHAYSTEEDAHPVRVYNVVTGRQKSIAACVKSRNKLDSFVLSTLLPSLSHRYPTKANERGNEAMYCTFFPAKTLLLNHQPYSLPYINQRLSAGHSLTRLQFYSRFLRT